MRAFACPTCQHLVFFHNSVCLHCQSPLGYDPDAATIVVMDPRRQCANITLAACNWLTAPVGRNGTGALCRCCALTRTRPQPNDGPAVAMWADVESAKRRLVYQLLDLGLPIDTLKFDLLSSADGPVVTGHRDGVITIDLAESDDAHREQVRTHLGEAYRTVLGHLRHEVGHYYWPILVRNDRLPACRSLFGDDQVDYTNALHHHYERGPEPDWQEHHVSAYATMHPWEDWAETFAHYLHIRDALQTAGSFGLRAFGPVPVPTAAADDLVATPRPDVGAALATIDALVTDWLALSYALNAMNRSMGKDDLYPFVLAPPVIAKLGFVHELVGSVRNRTVNR